MLHRLPTAVIHGPAGHGDLFRVSPDPGDTVLLIDGHYHQSGAVRHKEILEFLRRDVRIIGCSSMGALRAAELHTLGMEGIGEVFGLYASGAIDADDEVAVAHGEGPEYRRVSEPLVNLRQALQLLTERESITAQMANEALAYLQELPYTRRSWTGLDRWMQSKGEPAGLVTSLAKTEADLVDVKKRDALDALGHCAMAVGAPAPAWHSDSRWRTTFLRTWQMDFSTEAMEDQSVSRSLVLSFRQLYEAGFPALWQRHVLEQASTACSSPSGTKTASDPMEAAASLGMDVAAAESDWLNQNESGTLSPTDKAARIITRAYRKNPQEDAALGIFDERGSSISALTGAAESIAINEYMASTYPDRSIYQLTESTLIEHLSNVWDAPDPSALAHAAHDRGFRSLEDAVEAARHFYLRHVASDDERGNSYR
ncbi:TfuA-like protein [Streptomyces virginiae]|uniref:TfuA-like protein n=1 Tax=Streptomyces virginiae TaxID=1961 RepID=UPI0033BC77AB